MDEAQLQLDGFLAKFSPEVEALAQGLLEKMRRRVPGATIMVYDNYNALAIGFGSSHKVSRAVLSLAVYPRWVNLFFLHAAALPDPQGRLRGTGSKVRHVRVLTVEALDDPAIDALIGAAMAASEPPFDPGAEARLIVKSISARHRPRRPADASVS
ncbi:MAG TPA: hypothetical protein VF603_04495 [Allosphingosinicella sp.]